jgi:hypothetical protein
MKPTLIDAALSLVPGAEISCYGETKIIWHTPEVAPVTEEQIQAELNRLIEEYELKNYQRLRAAEYPSIEDQLDLLYHKGVEGWKLEIKKIKDKYLKT